MPYKDNKTRRAAYHANPARHNRAKEQYRYGIHRDDMIELLGNDNCTICGFNGGAKRNAIDHCSETNTARGFLCAACNTGLGLFKHRTDLLRQAIAYLERPPLVPPDRYARLLRAARGKPSN